jgi:hypothetical protein
MSDVPKRKGRPPKAKSQPPKDTQVADESDDGSLNTLSHHILSYQAFQMMIAVRMSLFVQRPSLGVDLQRQNSRASSQKPMY